jgi:hypothetical protein
MKPWQAPLNKAPSQGRKEEKRERWKVMGCNLWLDRQSEHWDSPKRWFSNSKLQTDRIERTHGLETHINGKITQNQPAIKSMHEYPHSFRNKLSSH